MNQAQQHVESNFFKPCSSLFPKAGKGFFSGVSKGQNHLVQADRVGQVDEGGSLRGWNYRPLPSVKKGLITAPKKPGGLGSHSRTAGLNIMII